MKTLVSFLVLASSLTLAGAGRLSAGEPPKSLEKGKVLLLTNEHTMEGDIARVGDGYRVRRLIGETLVPADRVLCLSASLTDAYAFLRSRANLGDADERLRLANWCRLNGLHSQALAEIRAAVELRPDHAETRLILQHLEQSAPTAAPSGPAKTAAPLDTEPAPPVELTTESLSLFATRVQPILMNTCASCHATGKGGKFRLTQAFESGLGNRRTLERNLSAVLGEINVGQPELSRLLTKAVSDHAHMGQPPLKDRKQTPYRTLESWVKLTVANNPHLRDSLPAAAAAPAAPPSAFTPANGTQWGADARSPVSSAPLPPAAPSAPVPVSNSVPAAPPPAPIAGPADPYDPEPFNRQMHPETNKPSR